ncbi:MAG: cyclic nucleotide-binding domain-containing protein [Bryobacterales bacterium]|nr:cyclic nucleotide-binding domain-containing protein [Bryobacterales bacterium]
MEIQSLENIIAEHPFFAKLDPAHIGLLVGCASNVRFEPGKYIFREGEEANHFYLIRQGRVSVEISPPQRRPIVVDTLDEGEILGWSWLVPPYQWRFHARAVDSTRAIALDGKCLREKCESNKELGYELLKRFSQIVGGRLDATRLQLLDLYAAH